MLPRLQAEEHLGAITPTAIGSGAMEQSAREDAIRRLERRANGGRHQRARPASRADLAGMGIGVREVSDG